MGQAKAVVDRVWETLESGNFDQVAELYAPDAEYVMPGGLRLRGVEQLVPLLQAYFAAFPDLRHEIVDYVESGDTIACELRITGTHTGTMRTPNGDIPPTGKAFVWESCDYIKVEGGKITSWHVYFDQVPFLTLLGLLPEPATA